MSRFWDALEKSYLITGTATIMFGGTACYIWANGGSPPPELFHLIEILIAAFIGGSTVQRAKAQKIKE